MSTLRLVNLSVSLVSLVVKSLYDGYALFQNTS
jgi:hypothetical protein